MRTWAVLLCGFLTWTVHFFALYIIASIWLTTPISRGLTMLVTAACLSAVAWLFFWARRQHAGTEMDRWVRSGGLAGLGVAGIAILWQGLPALLG